MSMKPQETDLVVFNSVTPCAIQEPLTRSLSAYYYEDRVELVPQLTQAFVECGGWVLERRPLSALKLEFHFEIHLDGIVDLYGNFLALGVELSRDSHIILTDLCNCKKYCRLAGAMGQVLNFRLEINFLPEMTLHSILATGHGTA